MRLCPSALTISTNGPIVLVLHLVLGASDHFEDEHEEEDEDDFS